MSEQDTKPRIVVAVNVNDASLEMLKAAAPEYRVERYLDEVPANVWADTEILFTFRSVPTPEQAPRLRWIQSVSAGFDYLLSRPIVEGNKDLMVTSTSGIHAPQIAEYCLGMMLALNMRIPALLDNKRDKLWPKDSLSNAGAASLRGRTVGIVGYGSIGRELARLCDALGMTVLAAKRDAMHPEAGDVFYLFENTGDPNGEIPARIYPSEAVATMAKECDFLVVTIPLTGGTRHSIDARIFEAMPDSAYFINIARGNVVDEPAMIEALQNQKIAGAALDVFAEEPLPQTNLLWTLPNVIISPHTAGNADDYNERAAKVFAENLRRYREQKTLVNLLDRHSGY